MTTQTILQHVRINGKERSILVNTTIKNYLYQESINPNIVACELNLKVIRRAELGNVILKDGDELEIIQMLGGG